MHEGSPCEPAIARLPGRPRTCDPVRVAWRVKIRGWWRSGARRGDGLVAGRRFVVAVGAGEELRRLGMPTWEA